MATSPSLDSTGLTVLRSADVRANLVEALEGSSEFGPDVQTGSDKQLGQIIDPLSDRIGEVYELDQAIYDAWDPDSAEGAQLENLCKLNGIERQPATASTVTLTLGGTPTTVIVAGKRARVPDGGIFALDADATIPGGGSVTAAATCTSTGATEAAATSIDEIMDGVSGWTTVTNAADATVGDEIETNLALRARREESLSRGGTSVDQALKASLEELDDVTAASVISNRTLVTDGNGTPGKAYLTVLWPDSGLDEDEIAETIWNHAPTGIYSHGTDVIATITDSSGHSQNVRWSYATEARTYWDVTVTKNADYPATGDALVKAAVVAYGATLSVGDDILPMGAVTMIMDSTQNDYHVPGIDHLVVKVGLAPAPAGTVPVAISATQISTTDIADVAVTS